MDLVEIILKTVNSVFPFFFLTKDEQKVKHKTIFKSQLLTCTCKN